jgi:hypothetical protein
VCLLARWFLARLILDPEDGSDIFLRNDGSCRATRRYIAEDGSCGNLNSLKNKLNTSIFTHDSNYNFFSGMNLTIVNKCIPMRHT